MTLWRSPHPDIQIPTDVTTWEWLFETEQYVPFSTPSQDALGWYIDAATGARLDFRQVKEQATVLSTVLVQDYGLRPEDTVSVFSTNTIWYAVALWATLRVGGRINGASPAYSAEEMTHALKTANTKLIFTLPSSLRAAQAAATAAGIPPSHVLLLEGTAPGIKTLQDLVHIGSSRNKPVPHHSIPSATSNEAVCAFLNFSSGTTGLPKAVMLSHHNMIAQCLQLRQLQLLPADGRYRVLAVMPLFHITGLVRFICYPVFMNGHCVMLPAFTMEAMLQAVIAHRIEELILVPPIIIRLVQDAVVERYLPQLRATIKRFSSGSAPMSPEVARALQAKFPTTGFRQGYGATESTACITCHPPTHFDYKYAHSGGLLVANTVAKVVDLADGAGRMMLGPGQTGEICAKGPQIAMGYLGNAAATAEAFDGEGFLRTGDVGHIDGEGLIFIEDRIKEMIKVKGIQVPPAELEDLLLGHEVVDDCAVLGVPDEYSGERPKAYVVLKQGVPASEELGQRLLQYVREKKVRFKWLAELEFAGSIPKSPTGKLLRRVLKVNEKDRSRKKGLSVRDESGKARL